MAKVPESVGLFICDVCDTPVDRARTVGLAPTPEQAKTLTGKKRKGIVLAFCPKCQESRVITEAVRKAAQQLELWYQSKE